MTNRPARCEGTSFFNKLGSFFQIARLPLCVPLPDKAYESSFLGRQYTIRVLTCQVKIQKFQKFAAGRPRQPDRRESLCRSRPSSRSRTAQHIVQGGASSNEPAYVRLDKALAKTAGAEIMVGCRGVKSRLPRKRELIARSDGSIPDTVLLGAGCVYHLLCLEGRKQDRESRMPFSSILCPGRQRFASVVPCSLGVAYGAGAACLSESLRRTAGGAVGSSGRHLRALWSRHVFKFNTMPFLWRAAFA